MKTALLIIFITIYILYSGWIEYKLLKNKFTGSIQKVSQSFLIWLFPVIGASLVNWLLKYKSPEGSHKNKIPSWKRLIKYEENGFG